MDVNGSRFPKIMQTYEKREKKNAMCFDNEFID